MIRNIVVPGFENIAQTPLNQITDVFQGSYHAVNVGGLPGTVVGVEGGLIFEKLPMKPPYLDGVPSHNPNCMLAAGSIHEFVLAPTRVTPDTLFEMLKRRAPIYFYALVDYVDAAGIRRRTSACGKFDYQTNRFVHAGDLDYEYVD